MAGKRTIVLDLLDPLGSPLGAPGSDWLGRIDVEYDRDVSLESGGRVPRRVASGVSLSPDGEGLPQVDVIPNDDPDLTEASAGFAIVLTLRLTPRAGLATRQEVPPRQWVVTVTSQASPTVRLSALPPADNVPAQYASAADWMAAVVAAAAGLDPDALTAKRLRAWRRKVENQATEQARAVIFSDSNGEGWFSSDPLLANRAQGVWRTKTRSAPGGGGWSPAVFIENGLPIDGSWSNPPGTAGVMVSDTSGLGLKCLGLPSDEWREWTFTGDRVRIWYSESDFVAAGAEVLIDGTKVADLAGSAGPDGVVTKAWTSEGLDRGEHTVRVVAKGIAGFVFLLEAAETFDGDFTKGVHIADGAHFGASTQTFVDNPRWKSGLALYDPHLVLVHLSSNDTSLYGADRYETNLASLLDQVKAVVPNASVAVCVSPERRDQPPIDPWSRYVAAAQRVSEAKDAYLLDLGNWMDPDGDLISQDGVHWSPAGQRFVGEVWSARFGFGVLQAATQDARDAAADARDAAGQARGEVTTLPNQADLNTYTSTGFYLRNSTSIPGGSTVALGFPYDGFAGFVEVISSEPNWIMQRATEGTGSVISSHGSFYRTKFSTNAWTPWRRVENGYSVPQTAVANDLNTLTTPGKYLVSGNPTNAPTSGFTGHVEVLDRLNADFCTQRATHATYIGATWMRRQTSGVWGSWVQTSDWVGNGAPTSNVAQGFYYTDQAATNGARRWYKAGSTMATWTVIDGDTGWRHVPASLIDTANWTAPAGTSTDYLLVRRVNDQVYLLGVLKVSEAKIGTSVNGSLAGLVTNITALGMGGTGGLYGLHGPVQHNAFYVTGSLTNTGTLTRLDASFAGASGSWTAAHTVRANASWFTPDQWPTTLPGTPA